MLTEKVGFVTDGEKEEIQKLHEKRLALKELLLTLCNPALKENEKDALYEKIVKDLGNVNLSCEMWWSKMSKKYVWKSMENGVWNIDFNTNEIFLMNNR